MQDVKSALLRRSLEGDYARDSAGDEVSGLEALNVVQNPSATVSSDSRSKRTF